MTCVPRLVLTQLEGMCVAAIPDIFYMQTHIHVQVKHNLDDCVKKM